MKNPINFIINPTLDNPYMELNKDLFIDIFCFKTKKEMYNYYLNTMNYSDKPTFDATVLTSKRFIYCKEIENMVQVDTNKVATTLFYNNNKQDRLGGSLVTHECVHIAFATLRHIQKVLNLNNEDCIDDEELLAYMIQSINRQINSKLFELKIW